MGGQPEVIANFIAALALVLTLWVALLTMWRERVYRRRAERAERTLQAFKLLTGGTQNRSAGIALIEGIRKQDEWKSEWEEAIVPLLVSQAIYLLNQSKQGDRPDELQNLRRIIDMLFDLNQQSDRSGATVLCEVIGRRLEQQGSGTAQNENRKKRGLKVPKNDLERWFGKFQCPDTEQKRTLND